MQKQKQSFCVLKLFHSFLFNMLGQNHSGQMQKNEKETLEITSPRIGLVIEIIFFSETDSLSIMFKVSESFLIQIGE